MGKKPAHVFLSFKVLLNLRGSILEKYTELGFMGILCCGILLSSCTLQEEEDSIRFGENLPDQESWNATIILTKEGKRRAVIKSGHLAKYQDRSEIILDGKVVADFYSAENKHMSNLKSRTAIVMEKTNDLKALGDVVVVSDSGVTLYTDELLWNNRLEKVVTEDTIMLTTESQDTLYGIGFQSNYDLSHWKIFKPWGVTQVRKSSPSTGLRRERSGQVPSTELALSSSKGSGQVP